MAINFPDTPTNGQLFIAGNTSYTYNSPKGTWDLVTATITTGLPGSILIPTTSSIVDLTFRGAVNQSADLVQFQDSNANILTSVRADGTHYLGAVTERTSLVATGFAGYTYDVKTSALVYITASSTANGTINFRGNSLTTISQFLGLGETTTVTLMITNGATAYYPNGFQIDGVSVTPKWSGGTAPSSGSTNATDIYQFSITKTAATPTYVVWASVAKFV